MASRLRLHPHIPRTSLPKISHANAQKPHPGPLHLTPGHLPSQVHIYEPLEIAHRHYEGPQVTERGQSDQKKGYLL